MSAKVKHLFIKAERGRPMVPSDSIECVAGFGLKGDASFGRSSRQVLLIDQETLLEYELNAGDVRENITTTGLNFTALETGSQLRIGPVLLEATGLCSPCSQLDELKPGLQIAITGRRGMLAKVLEGGTIVVGDQILVESQIKATRTES